MKQKQNETGVSPVVGIILMVAVTVALVALASNFVFDVGGESTSSATASVEISVDQGANTSSAQLLKNSSADSVSVEFDGESNSLAETEFDGVGGVVEFTSGNDGEVVDVIVTAEVDGEEQVIRTKEVEL